ncbi:TlpA family protein disulfide reductase [bacterium]|nr:TlpA family protein disulfide reductase [bacterium]
MADYSSALDDQSRVSERGETMALQRFLSFSRVGAAVLLIVFFGVGCSSRLPEALAPGQQVPLTRITSLDGSYQTLQQFRGRDVAVFFWAKWCSKSRRALARFEELARSYQLQGRGTDIQFIAINLDKYQEEIAVRRFVEAEDIRSVQVAFSGNGADDEAALAFRAFEIPIAFHVNRQGIVQLASHDVDDLRKSLPAS